MIENIFLYLKEKETYEKMEVAFKLLDQLTSRDKISLYF